MTTAFSALASFLNLPDECTATLGISLPSPPSAGVSTRRRSGHSTAGIESAHIVRRVRAEVATSSAAG